MRGDPRGWRSRHHREHAEGDYKNPPPPGTYDSLYEQGQSLMKRDPVKIASELRKFVVDAIAAKLLQDRVQTLIASVDAKHLHLLARFTDHNVRHWIGRAKKHASHALRQQGLRTEEGGLWAKRCHLEPIIDREHQINCFGYILAHAKRGARVLRFDASEHHSIELRLEKFILILPNEAHN